MGFLLIILRTIVHQFEAMIVRRYGRKHGKGGMFFNAMICLFATIYFFITDKGGLHFPKEIVLYGAINSVMYGIGFYAAYVTLRTGAFALTRLFTSIGVFIPVFYGVVFLKETPPTFTGIALPLIFIAMFLINYQGKEGVEKVSLEWIVGILLVVFSNAAISIIGKMQYDVCGDTYKNEYLILSFLGATAMLLVMGVVFERDCFKTIVRKGLLYGASAGICNGTVNLLVLITYKYLPISVISPVGTGIGIVAGFMLSIFVYKEKLKLRQLIGAAIGGTAVVLMSL